MEKQVIETNVIKPRLAIFQDDAEYRLITKDVETQLDAKISEIETFMASNHGFGKEDAYKDELYTKAKEIWGQYAETLQDVRYTFYLNRKQYNFLTSLLRDKLEYDINTVFLAIELTNMIGTWVSTNKGHKGDKELRGYDSDATDITYMYHLIAKHKVKGLTENTYLFAEILKKIGDISKIINYYDTAAKNLSSEIQKWVASFEPEVRKDDVVDVESADEPVKGKKLSAKKKEEA